MAQDAMDRYIDLELELAKRAHEVERDHAAAHWKQAEAFSLLTLRSIGLVSAGGIAAVLGFFSANYQRLVDIPGSIDRLNGILGGLFVALLLGLLSAGAGYWSQTLYAKAKWDLTFSTTRPFITETKASKLETLIGSIFRWCSIVFAVAAIVVLMVAGWLFLGVIR